MEKLLLVQVHLLDGRYYGAGDWPPAPARLFQALIAGNAIGAMLPQECKKALLWFEKLPKHPDIYAETGKMGLLHKTFVPNNDLDAIRGNPKQVADIRVSKQIQPRHLEIGAPIVYVWRFQATNANMESATKICDMADNIYQLGRGVDIAWAQAEILDIEIAEQRLTNTPSKLFYPGRGEGELTLDCPQGGSLTSLQERFQGHRHRFYSERVGDRVETLFTNPPKARFQPVTYNPSERWQLYDLRGKSDGESFFSWPLNKALILIEQIRDKAAQRLKEALPEQAGAIDRLLVGRNANQDDKQRRVRLIPIPSIGHEHADALIRRLLVCVPSACPLSFDDIAWAFSGLILDTQSTDGTTLIAADDVSMLRHYALESGESHRIWHSVTAVALSLNAKRRADPKNRAARAKTGSARAAKEKQARIAVLNALRHAGLPTCVDAIHVQREPLFKNGARADTFATGRFREKALWHVKIHFARPVEGMIVIGNGRYLGLGLMAPHKRAVAVLAYHIEAGLVAEARPDELTRALRRAVMARVQSHSDSQPLPSFFTGHDKDGQPLRRGNHQHLAFVADLPRQRLLIIPPHTLEKRVPYPDERNKYLPLLDAAMEGFSSLCAGRSGRLSLSQIIQSDPDPLLGSARRWESLTSYKPTRHAKHQSPEDALCNNILGELRRQGLPQPEIEALSVTPGPRGGLEGRLRLLFKREQSGPILLGRTRHFGGGLFQAMPHKA